MSPVEAAAHIKGANSVCPSSFTSCVHNERNHHGTDETELPPSYLAGTDVECLSHSSQQFTISE